jgi:hypothetical protein
MAKQSDVGYKLVIIYDAKQKNYHLTGYTGHGEFHIHYAQDGATLVFNSLEEVVKHISNYSNDRG